jgi:hypothetical protein
MVGERSGEEGKVGGRRGEDIKAKSRNAPRQPTGSARVLNQFVHCQPARDSASSRPSEIVLGLRRWPNQEGGY